MFPKPTVFGSKDPAERARMVRERAEKAEAARRKAAQERRTQLEKLGGKIAIASQAAEQDLIEECKRLHVFPVRLGNPLGPEGNVLNVMGAVRSGIRWAEKNGVVLPDAAYQIVNGFMKRTYDETLDMIESHALDLDNFVDRYRNREHELAGEIRFGDNPIGGYFGQ